MNMMCSPILPINHGEHSCRAGHAKKTSAELDDDDCDSHVMYLDDLFYDGTSNGLSLEDVQTRAIERVLMHCANPFGALATACIESLLNPPPLFQDDDVME